MFALFPSVVLQCVFWWIQTPCNKYWSTFISNVKTRRGEDRCMYANRLTIVNIRCCRKIECTTTHNIRRHSYLHKRAYTRLQYFIVFDICFACSTVKQDGAITVKSGQNYVWFLYLHKNYNQSQGNNVLIVQDNFSCIVGICKIL